MKVLVTGGAGFIGSHVLDRLAAAGFEPRCFDRRPSPHHDPDALDTVIGDILDPLALGAAMEGCDAVLHLAAAADVGEVANDPAGAEALNARGTLNVLEAARDRQIGHVLYASTIWVYSDAVERFVDEEHQLALPSHLYTATKLAGEAYCRSYAALYGVRTTILRFGIPYGPRARPAAVVPAFVEKALGGEPLTIAGDGSQSRRFVYVEDLAEGAVAALDRDGPEPFRVYDLVGERDVTIREIAEVVRETVGEVEIVHTPARSADFGGVAVSGARALSELGWSAQTPFEEGVRRFDSSVAGLGGCPFAAGATGNICTEDLVYLLHESGYRTGIDLYKAIEVARKMEQTLGRQLSGQVMRAGPRLTLHEADAVGTAAG